MGDIHFAPDGAKSFFGRVDYKYFAPNGAKLTTRLVFSKSVESVKSADSSYA